MKHLETTPGFICDKEDTNYCVYVDTDSNYYNAEPLLRYLYPNFDNMSEEERDEALEKIALKYQDLITKSYNTLALEAFNIQDHRFDMKTECMIRAGYFRAPRRYAQWITKKEGVSTDDLDIKGLEFMKANFPQIFSDFFKDVLQKVIKGTQQKEIDEMLKYNDLLTFWKLGKQHSKITQGDKIKWIYLKDNPYRIDALAFLDFDMPDKIRTLLSQYADTNKSFETILESKLAGFYNDLGWDLNMNPYRNMFFNF